MIRITDTISIDESELSESFVRASGPGGQNVNKVETKATLRFDIEASRSLATEQKEKISDRLTTRITKDGILRITSQRHRTREANRHAAIARFIELIDEALSERAARKPTKVSRAAKKRRLENKRRRSQKKAMRRAPAADD